MESIIPQDELNRLKHKGVTDLDQLYRVLDENRAGTLAYVGDNQFPYQIPIAYVRRDNRLLLHGSSGAGALRAVADGRPVSFGVFRTTALVLARSGFESSMNYESAILFGHCTSVPETDKDELATFVTEKLFPGRTAELRPNSKKELAATLVLELKIEHWNLKISAEGPTDPDEDLDQPVWAGKIPIVTSLGEPIPADDLNPAFANPPTYLKNWKV
jgi:nitroimidazol reductase NimA-like FMN-containing flavoprotein (pyridoxamine 5'-phosphate oxidase superfamily)